MEILAPQLIHRQTNADGWVVFLPLHAFSNGAVMPSLDVRLSVCLSVTLVSTDHIHWGRWNVITRLISPMSSLAAGKTSAI